MNASGVGKRRLPGLVEAGASEVKLSSNWGWQRGGEEAPSSLEDLLIRTTAIEVFGTNSSQVNTAEKINAITPRFSTLAYLIPVVYRVAKSGHHVHFVVYELHSSKQQTGSLMVELDH